SPFIRYLFSRTVGGQFFRLSVLEIRPAFTHQYPVAVVRLQLQVAVFIPPLFLSLLAAFVVCPAYSCRIAVFIPSPIVTDKRTRTVGGIRALLSHRSIIMVIFKGAHQLTRLIVGPSGKYAILGPGF